MGTATDLQQSEGRTPSRAPFIESAKRDGQLYIGQPYKPHFRENHKVWKRLFTASIPLSAKCPNFHIHRGIANLALPNDRVPELGKVNRFLSSLTGFPAKLVSGYVLRSSSILPSGQLTSFQP